MWTPDPARKPSDSQVRSYVTKTHFLAISCISTSPPTAVSPTTFRLHLDNYSLLWFGPTGSSRAATLLVAGTIFTSLGLPPFSSPLPTPTSHLVSHQIGL